jgi:coronin-7
VLPLSSVGKNHVPVTSPAYQQPLLRAHSQAVQDVAFSPHDPHRLFSCAADGSVKLWAVPEGGYLADESAPAAVLTPSFSGSLKGLAMHASAADLLAVRGVKDAALFDLGAGAESLVLPQSLLGGAELQSLSWSFLGDRLLAASKDKNVRLIDPRAGVVESCFECHAGPRNMKAAWLGDTPYLLSCGLGATQQREFALWDSRMAGGAAPPVRRERVDTGRGLLLPIFDSDNGLLLLVGKGDVSLRLYEFDKSKSDLFSLASVNVGDAIKGACLMPKQANSLMACEVLRVLKLTENAVQPISFTVPRKEKLQFHGDLFPPTTDGAPASMSAGEWLGGANAPPAVVPLSPSAAKGAAAAFTAAPAASDAGSTAATSTEEEVASPTEAVATAVEATTSRVSSMNFGSSIGSSKFKHLFGTESPRNSSYFNLRPNVGTAESPLLACSDQFWAIPWAGTGGPIYVSKMGAYGKVEPSAAIIDAHRGAVQDLAFSPFHSDILASAADDCKVKIWKIPEEGIVGQNFVAGDEAASLDSHTHSVRTCNFHPTISGLLATSSYDMSIKLWDVEHGAAGMVREVKDLKTGLPDMGSSVSNLAFNYDGSMFAVSCRDRSVRLCDVRSRFAAVDEIGSSSMFSSSTTSAQLGRNLRVAWCGSPSLNVILTTSASMASGMRQIHLWDPRKLSEPTAVRNVDNASGALFPVFDPDTSMCFIASRGDTSIRYYDVSASDDAPAACVLLNQFQGSSAPISGVCLLPKKGCNVRDIEANRVLKLAGDVVTSVSFVLPRAEQLRDFFQDDVFPDTQLGPTLTCSEWLTDTNQAISPVLSSLKPKDMDLLSARRASMPIVSDQRSKIESFKAELQQKEDEKNQKDDMFNKLQQLAQQRASYHPNPSGGAVDPNAKKDEDSDSSDGGWND